MSSLLPEAAEAVEVLATRGKLLPDTLQFVGKIGEKIIDGLNGFNTIDQGVKNIVEDGKSVVHELEATIPGVAKKLVKDAATFIEPYVRKLDHGLETIIHDGKPGMPAVAPVAPAVTHPTPAAQLARHEVVGLGSMGVDVRELQKDLGVRVDGIDGERTTAALKAFQREHGLKADGIAGEKTWAALEPTVHEGSRGEAVRRIQAEVGVPVDGIEGPQTTAALKRFQEEHGLKPDGIAGSQTWQAINGAGSKATPPNVAGIDPFVSPKTYPFMPPAGQAGLPYLPGGDLRIRYGNEDRDVTTGFQQSGRILSVKDGILTQETGKTTVQYHVDDLVRGAKDPEAVEKMLTPGRNIEIAITPERIQMVDLDRGRDLDRGHDIDRTQTHSR
jgi:peptidoglycan hydrolase-like protein with peptidoglycan-binding domain